MPEVKKTLYHGELRDAGPTKVTVVSEPVESKHKRGTFYVELTVAGKQRYLHPENAACLDFWRGKKGQTVSVVAEGKGEDARIVLVGSQAHSAPQGRAPKAEAPPTPAQPAPRASQRTPPPAPAAAAPNSKSKSLDALHKAKQFVGGNRSLAQVALKAAMSVAADYEKVYEERMPDALLAAVFGAMLYGTTAAGHHLHLPRNLSYPSLEPAKESK